MATMAGFHTVRASHFHRGCCSILTRLFLIIPAVLHRDRVSLPPVVCHLVLIYVLGTSAAGMANLIAFGDEMGDPVNGFLTFDILCACCGSDGNDVKSSRVC